MSVITDLIDENSSCHARIAELEARIVELESAAESLRISRDYHHEQENEYRRRWAGVTTGAHSIVIPERDAVIRKAVGMCNRIPGSTTWNAAEYAYDELVAILYAAPVSEAKAQCVVMPERWNVPRPMWKDARQPYGNPLNHADIEAAEKFNLALDEVARLNAAPVQQVSVQVSGVPSIKCWSCHSVVSLDDRADADGSCPNCCVELDLEEYLRTALAAAPAAPAADAWLVEALDYQVLFDAIAAATSVYANGAVNISVQVFRDALAAHRAKGVV